MERNHNGDLVACYCQQCLASTTGFQMVTSRVRDHHQSRALRAARDRISYNGMVFNILNIL